MKRASDIYREQNLRPPRGLWLMDMAYLVAQRSTCSRNHVGVVVAQHSRVISTGYNGTPAGMPHCQHDDDPAYDDYPITGQKETGCKISVHAEANAITYAAKYGISINGASLYTTLSPCYTCSQLIINAGIQEVVYSQMYRDHDGIGLLKAGGVNVAHLGDQ